MDLDVNTLSSILFSSQSNAEFIRQLNLMLKYMIERDQSFVSTNNPAPKTWECKWLNQPDKIQGYPKGYAVWVNSGTYDQIFSSKRQTIESYVLNNSTLNSMYSAIDQTDSTAKNQFLMRAAKGTASDSVSAIYFLGDPSDRVQIRISTVDNNKAYPDDLCCWEDFFTYSSYEDNVSALISAARDTMEDLVDQHLQEYHMLGVTSADLQLSGYFKASPFNASDVKTQKFFDHTYCDSMSGLDYVVRQKMLADGSMWCRVWKSGYVEQGGFAENIPGEALIPVQFMTTYNYPVGPSFYQRGFSTYAGSYPVDNPMQASNRYIVTVTPVLDSSAESPYPAHPQDIGGELVYTAVDVTNMSNNGFSIVNTDMGRERYSKYSWHACGYKVIDSESQMFDNSMLKSASGTSMFSITSQGVLTSFANDSYAIVNVPSNVLSIGSNVFKGAASVMSLVLPKGLESIGAGAFSNCTSLRGIALPDGVTSIPDQAFCGCTSLMYAKLGTGVDFIGLSAFCNDSSLATVSRFADADPSHTFDKVGNYAFYNCGLKKANLSLRSAGIDNFWGDYCFADNTSLEEVNILSACYMSDHMFAGCTSLKTVNFKNNQTNYVYPSVFEGCSSLTGIVLPSRLWYISEAMFKDCTSLKEVTFSTYDASSSMMNLIQKNAFNGCTSLRKIALPASLTSISQLDDACLSNCSLTSIQLNGVSKADLLDDEGKIIPSIYTTGMFRLNHDCTIICKDGTVSYTYDAARTTPYSPPTDYYDTTVNLSATTGFQIASTAAKTSPYKYWYYKAQPLFNIVKSSRRPCVFIYSLLGCKPCQIYMQKVFNNAGFQAWAAKQNFYLCGMEVDRQPYYDTDLKFCVDTLVPQCSNFVKADENETEHSARISPNALGNIYTRKRVDSGLLNSDLYTPVIVFYYDNGSSVTAYAHTFHNIDKEINAWGLDGVIQCFKSLCLYYFDNNVIKTNGFVVDAGKAFDIDDYPNVVTPSTPESRIVIPTAGDGAGLGAELTTTADVYADICKKLRNEGLDDFIYNDGRPCLMGCAFGDVWYLSTAYPGIDSCDTYDDVMSCINDNSGKRFKIGDNYFTLNLVKTKSKTVVNPCGAESSFTAYAVEFIVNNS